MKPNSPKNQGLIKQFPFVREILQQHLAPLGADDAVDTLTIKVQRADGDLMYRVAKNIGISDNGCIIETKGARDDQLRRQGEYLFAIGDDGLILNRLNWPSTNWHSPKDTQQKIYGQNVLFVTRRTDETSEPIHDKVRFLVWITVQVWHEQAENPEYPFGAFRGASCFITIYRAPHDGFHELWAASSVYENLTLDNQTLIQGALSKDYNLNAVDARLGELCRIFQDEVYLKGMKEVLDAGKDRSATGVFGSVQVLAGEICGYDCIMLRDENSYIAFQLRPGDTYMHVRDVHGTLPQVRRLTMTVISAWSHPDHAARDTFKLNSDVRPT